MSAAAGEVAPTGWAGGAHVCIPGVGVGRIILENPRVIEVDLPIPECGIFVVDGPAGPRAVVLADPRVPYPKTLRAIAAARLIEESAAAEVLDGTGAPEVAELLAPHGRPRLQLVPDPRPADDACCPNVAGR